MCAARQLGYRQKSEHWDMQYDFANELDYPLPKGFHFVNRQDMDMEKVSKCCFKGFDHEQSEGPCEHAGLSVIYSPFMKAWQGVTCL